MKVFQNTGLLKMLTKNRYYMLLITVLIAFIIFSIRSEPTYDFGQVHNMQEKVEDLEIENSRLKTIKNNLESTINEYKRGISIGLSDEEILKKDLDFFKKASGMSDVCGEGIIVLLSDGSHKLKKNQDPNSVLIHDDDVKRVLFEIRNAGAEAISINEERYIFNYTSVQCNGPTIKIGDKKFSQPFIIKAIGSRKKLSEALNNVNSHIYMLKQNGLFVEVNTSIYIEIKAHKKDLVYRYIEEEK